MRNQHVGVLGADDDCGSLGVVLCPQGRRDAYAQSGTLCTFVISADEPRWISISKRWREWLQLASDRLSQIRSGGFVSISWVIEWPDLPFSLLWCCIATKNESAWYSIEECQKITVGQ